MNIDSAGASDLITKQVSRWFICTWFVIALVFIGHQLRVDPRTWPDANGYA